jgi:predicted amidohydrolase YtcJ
MQRRLFIKRLFAALGGAVATACGRRLQRLSGTGTPVAQANPTSAPTETAPQATTTTEPSALSLPTPAPSGAIPPTPTVISSPAGAPTLAGPAADMILANGKVITVDGTDRIAQAVAVKDGLIQAVGTNDEIRALAGEKTKQIDLQGRALTPGLIDPHNHVQVMGMMGTYYASLLPPDVRSLDDLRSKLKELAAQTPTGEWVVGYYLAVTEGRLPNRADLDLVTPDHPVWLVQMGGHYGSANSLALQAAKITSATKDPEGGVIERDAHGEPTGVFYNHRAMDLLRKAVPQQTHAQAVQNIIDTQRAFAACGVTSFQDNNVRGVDNTQAYFEVDRQGQMLIRGAIHYTLEWPNDLDRALNEVERYQDTGFMRLAGFKFLLDGQAKMAYCHEPHNGVRWDLPTWEPQSFKDAVRELHKTGLQICTHCIGDAATDLTLDAYESAMNASPRPDPRHRIEHCLLSTPQATRRMRDLGVVVSTQPSFIRLGGDYYASVFGEERMARIIVTREWLDEGVHLALGSDAPTTLWYTPQVTLFATTTRLTATNRTFHAEQCLTIQEALRAHTMGSAYAAQEETVKGSIEVGKLADMVIWSADLYTATAKELWQLPVAMTLVGGKVVYQT